MPIIKLDANGRIELPSEIRDKLKLNGDCELDLDYLRDGTIIIKKICSQQQFEKWLEG
ncbi:MAG: AbrB/MazE/SpoVT family DNA-binding domain-containing protein [Methanotrichaceae archaeon]